MEGDQLFELSEQWRVGEGELLTTFANCFVPIRERRHTLLVFCYGYNLSRGFNSPLVHCRKNFQRYILFPDLITSLSWDIVVSIRPMCLMARHFILKYFTSRRCKIVTGCTYRDCNVYDKPRSGAKWLPGDGHRGV